MAEINVERKSGFPWLWVILGLLVLALIIWWVMPDEEPVAVAPLPAPAVVDAPPPVPVAQGPAFTVADVLGNPTPWIGRTVTPQALRVAEVPSDRGFWVEEQGQRMFVVLNEGGPGTADVQGQAAEQPDINPGDMIQITEAMVHDATFLQNIQGTLSPETRQILEGQQVFLVTDGRNIRKM